MKRTNVVLDEEVVGRAKRLTGIKATRQLIDYALRELLRRRRQRDILKLRGRVDREGDLGELRRGRLFGLILVDTSVWIDFFRGEDIAICGPVLMEIRQGATSDRMLREIERLFAPLLYLPAQRRTYCLASDLYRAARAKGKTIRNAMDCLIAACAIEHRARLLQGDRDYAAIAGVSKLELLRP